MTFLPVVARELRVASRRPWTYWSRVFSGGLTLMLCSWIALVGSALRAGANGEPLFFALSVPALGFAFLAGLLYAADSVSGEKRDGTLGLLFLTDLRGHDVTLGKLAGTSLGAIYGLVAMLPFLALTLLLGGITGADYGRMSLVLLVTLFTSLATGLLASVLTVDVRRSVLLAFVLMLLVMAGVPVFCTLVHWFLTRGGRSGPLIDLWNNQWAWNLSPTVGFGTSGARAYKTEAHRYWISVGFTAAVGILSLLVASWRLPHTWQDSGESSSRSGVAGWLRRLRFPGPESFLRFRRTILDVNPVTWLSARHWLRPWLPWLFLAGVGVTAGWIQVLQGGGWWDIEVCFGLSSAIHIALKLWVANEAPRQFLDDRRTGAMELLLSTPLTPAEILAGQWRALQRQFLGPVILVLLVDFCWMVSNHATNHDGGPPILSILWGLRMILLVVDLWAIGWTGFWEGMTGRGRATAAILVLRILVLPWIVWIGIATFVGLTLARSSADDSLMWLLIAAWFVLGIGNDTYWAVRARGILDGTFREVATHRPGERRGWFGRRTAETL